MAGEALVRLLGGRALSVLPLLRDCRVCASLAELQQSRQQWVVRSLLLGRPEGDKVAAHSGEQVHCLLRQTGRRGVL